MITALLRLFFRRRRPLDEAPLWLRVASTQIKRVL